MTDVVWFVFAFIACLLAMALFALASKNQWYSVQQRVPFDQFPTTFRLGAATCLVIGLICFLQADYFGMALSVWLMMITISAVVVAMVLSAINV